MPYRLPREVAVCLVEEQAIFLDTARDRYFSVGGAGAQAVRALLEQQPSAALELDKLVKAGLMEVGEPTYPLGARPLTAPCRSLVEEGAVRPIRGIMPIVEFTLAMAKARHDLTRRSLASLLDDLRQRKSGYPAGPDTSCSERLQMAATFNAVRRLAPMKLRCLPDSLALLACLARRGLSADLVFGVKLNPFSAHCWVQAGDVVLNDAIDHVTLHTPILLV